MILMMLYYILRSWFPELANLHKRYASYRVMQADKMVHFAKQKYSKFIKNPAVSVTIDP